MTDRDAMLAALTEEMARHACLWGQEGPSEDKVWRQRCDGCGHVPACDKHFEAHVLDALLALSDSDGPFLSLREEKVMSGPKPRNYDEPASHVCIEQGCEQPAGTPWTGLWCARHDVMRLERIGSQLRDIQAELTRRAQ